MTSAVEHKCGAIEKIMAARADNTTSETVLSNVTMENECNFYGSGVGETSEASMDVRPRPCSFGTKQNPS